MNKFVIVDIETTGNSLKKGDRIIQFAAVTVESGAIVDTYTTFINPQTEISPFITELTGIDHSTVKGAPLFSEVAEDILRIMDQGCFVAHNVHFDLTFLQDELEYAGKRKLSCPIIDTVELSRILMPTLESYKLQDIALFAGFDHDRPHQADSDALVTAEWFLSLVEKANDLPVQTLFELTRLAKELSTDLQLLLSSILNKKQKESYNLPTSLEEYRGIIIKRKEDKLEKDSNTYAFPESDDELRKLLQTGYGTNFENRKEQTDMIKLVFHSLQNGDMSLIEAEPGFGKTISYLLSAAIYSINQKKPIVIATHTIQQQHQIIENEVPRIKKMLGDFIQCTIVKGKTHYLNLWKFERLLNQTSENYDETIAKMQILVWLTETVTGDLDEINLSSGGLSFWKRLSAEFPGSTDANPWENYDFYYHALIRANSANIIITNHHFLMSDMTGDFKFLPEYNDVIIDEAHQFERNAAKFFGHFLGFRKIKYWLSQFGSIDQTKLLSKIIKLRNTFLYPISPEKVQSLLEQFSLESEEFFQLCASITKRSGRNVGGRNSVVVSFREHTQLKYAWERLYDSFSSCFSILEELYRDLLFHYDTLDEEQKLIVEDYSVLLLDFNQIDHIHKDIFLDENNMQIIWLESDDRTPLQSATLYTIPISIGNYLSEYLYTEKKSIIFTSATLTVKNSFSYISEQLGLTGFPVIEQQFRSDFPYSNLVKLFAMEDIPDVASTSQEDFVEVISSHIISIATTLQGRVLVLFTSHDMLKQTYYLIKESETLEDYVLLAQGISGGSPNRLAKQFNRFEKTILFGSYTFWEGVDIGKESLAGIIMVRLPFSSPQEPVHHGKAQMVKHQGRNPFYDYSLPEAVIRFKQGFGRLVRSNQHKGHFIIFDNRIIKSRYRQTFLQSIPKLPLNVTTIESLCLEIDPE